MIESGEKPEEYRELNAYWIKRLIDERITDRDGVGGRWRLSTQMAQFYAQYPLQLKYDLAHGKAAFRNFSDVHFTLGYPKADDTSRNMERGINEIVIAKGNPNWGAVEDKEYFVIRLKD